MRGATRAARVRRALGTVAIAGVVGLGGCATITYDTGTLQNAIAMNRVAESVGYERLGSFEEQTRAVFVIADLLTVVDSNLEEIMERELARTGGDAIINLRIHEEYDIIDAAIGLAQGFLLFGGRVVGTRTITYNGDVVRWTGGPDEVEEALSATGANCRAIDVVAGEGGTRKAYVCAE